MKRKEFEDAVVQARRFGGYGLDPFFESFLRHDAEQRQVIANLERDVLIARNLASMSTDLLDERNKQIEQQAQQIAALKSELSHWSWVRFKQLEEENATLREALQGILEIGKRDMTNPKYDGYFEQAQQALNEVNL